MNKHFLGVCVALTLSLSLVTACSAGTRSGAPPATGAADYCQNVDPHSSLGDQCARTNTVRQGAANKKDYANRYDLSGIPEYRPAQQVSGTIRQWGSNYFADSGLMQTWERQFQTYQPQVKFADTLNSSEEGIAGLYTGVADDAPMGRKILWQELTPYQRQMNSLPLEVTVCTGSYDVDGWSWAIGIMVNKDNPLSQLTTQQLDGIFGGARTGGWKGLDWDPSVARGADADIRTWGQLGLTGQWANAPIHVYGYPRDFHFPDEMEKKVFHGGDVWNESMKEYANSVDPDGKLQLAGAKMMNDLSHDPDGIAFTGIDFLTPQTKALAIAKNLIGPFIPLTRDNVQNRSYPLIRNIYFYTNQHGGTPTDPAVAEFIKFILSRQGQQDIEQDAKYLPLTAQEYAKEIPKLK